MRRLAAILLLLSACASSGDEGGASGPGGKADDPSESGSELPDPNADEAPPADWLPPPVAEWPDAYVIFNNTGCGRACGTADQEALKSRSVMVKLLVAAIHEVKEGGIIRVANFNISSSSGVTPVVDALMFAMRERGGVRRRAVVAAPGVVEDDVRRRPLGHRRHRPLDRRRQLGVGIGQHAALDRPDVEQERDVLGAEVAQGQVIDAGDHRVAVEHDRGLDVLEPRLGGVVG